MNPTEGLSCEDVLMRLAEESAGIGPGSADAALEEHLQQCPQCWLLAESSDDGRELGALKANVVQREFYVRGPELGRGGMGRTINAWDRRLGRVVALKELLDPKLRDRFEREARLTARLQHPNIVGVLELGTWEDGSPFYTMRRIPGRPLGQLIAEATSLGARMALLPSVLAMVDAVAYAHDERIVHRDLKPANALVGEHGETVVIDWGLAKDLTALEAIDCVEPAAAPRDELTRTGVGTVQYMPPEQALGLEPNERVDVYGLGATLYHLLAGCAPYANVRAEERIDALLRGPPEPLSRFAPQVPGDLQTIVSTAMAREPADRFASAGEMAAELRRFQAGRLVEAHDYTFLQRMRRGAQRHRKALGIALAVAALLGVEGKLALNGLLRDRASTEQSFRQVLEERAREDALQTASLASGAGHECIIINGGVKCWGDNVLGQLGNNTTQGSNVAIDVPAYPAGSGVQQLALNTTGYTTCALINHQVSCWGLNNAGQLGNGDTGGGGDDFSYITPYPVPVIGLPADVTAIVGATLSGMCALTAGGDVWCWGDNSHGLLGNNNGGFSAVPVKLSSLSQVLELHGGFQHTCAILTNQSIVCWGANDLGQLGNGTFVASSAPVQVIGFDGSVAVQQLTTGGSHGCVLVNDGVQCWGQNDFGCLGDDAAESKSAVPVQAIGLTSGVEQVVAGSLITCAITFEHAALCWGDNRYEAVGDGTSKQRNVPTQVVGLTSGVNTISPANAVACVTDSAGVQCWGDDEVGTLGDGTYNWSGVPVTVVGVP